MDAKTYITDYIKQAIEQQDTVSSREYLQWLYDFILGHESMDTDAATYRYRGTDSENGQLLGALMDYVKILAKEQNVPVTENPECEFYNQAFIIKIQDRYFRIFQMYGQGSWTCVTLTNEQEQNYVTLE